MKKELIDDSRLTPTMKRIRSGRTQLFREPNKDDRSFIDNDNCDISLEHKNKEMFAELIDKKWYWVNGCAECNGDPRDWMTYMECEAHDVCRNCKKSRADLPEDTVAWGGKNGWQCGICKATEIQSEKNNYIWSEDKTSYESNVICPHCGYKHESDGESSHFYEPGEEQIECGYCSESFKVETFVETSYTTTK